MARFYWTAQLDDSIRALSADRKTAAQIAVVIGEAAGRMVSRNAVLGRLFRLKIAAAHTVNGRPSGTHDSAPRAPRAMRPVAASAAQRKEKNRRIRVARAPMERSRVGAARRKEPGQPLSFLAYNAAAPRAKRSFEAWEKIFNLRISQCRFPIGNLEDGNFHLCGAAREIDAETQYCNYHHFMATSTVK